MLFRLWLFQIRRSARVISSNGGWCSVAWFSAATQDIVIDAYRIELAETQMQTVLAATYNAGYRIGMIVAGAGALFLAAYLGTAKGNYIYEAWKYTYLTMAAVMLVGILTTLIIREPKVDRVYKSYQRRDYFRLVLVFLLL